MKRSRASWKSELAYAKAFFAKYPTLPPKQMDLSDFNRENPGCGIRSLVNLKGLHTRLVRLGVLP